MLALLPASATLIGAVVLGQIPGMRDVLGVFLAMGGVAIHQPSVEPNAKTVNGP
jgi:inner membrane transporter RhtA